MGAIGGLFEDMYPVVKRLFDLVVSVTVLILVLPILTAISVWAEGMRLLPGVPKDERVAFYNGLGIGLIFAATVASATGFYLAGNLPPLLKTIKLNCLFVRKLKAYL